MLNGECPCPGLAGYPNDSQVRWRKQTHMRLVATVDNFLGPNSALVEISESSAIDLNGSRIGT